MNTGDFNIQARKTSSYDVAWTEAARNISTLSISGLKINCPACRKMGTLISKWEKGCSVKPLYVVHNNGNGHFKACLLDIIASNKARTKICLRPQDIIKLLRIGKPFVLFSGGRDSLCTLEYIKRLSEKVGIEITALHANTTAGFPEVEEYIAKVCHQMKLALVTVKPDRNFFELAKKWGIPGVKSRWCCETLKIAPIKNFLATLQGPKIIFDGIRAVESSVRAKYVPVWFHPSFRSVCVSPIFGWSDQKVEKYIHNNNLPINPTAELGTSGECWCGAYKGRSDFENLLEVHPDIFDKLVAVEKAQRGKYTYIYEHGKRVPLSSLKAKKKINQKGERSKRGLTF